MAASFAPVEAAFAQGSAALGNRRHVEPQFGHEPFARRRKANSLTLASEGAGRDQMIEHAHRQLTGEMVVADACAP